MVEKTKYITFGKRFLAFILSAHPQGKMYLFHSDYRL